MTSSTLTKLATIFFVALMCLSAATTGVVATNGGGTTAASNALASPAVGETDDERLTASGPTDAQATLQQPDFSTSTFLSNVNQPMGMAFLPDGRALVIEKPGTIQITDPNDGTKSTETYLDISGRVNDGRERGLIDITLDPDFEENGYVYLFYSYDSVDKNRIARFAHEENGGGLQSTADASSEFVVWQEAESWDSCCHQGAGLDFGPDEKLWLTMGDDFHGGAVSQDLSRDGGKIIRVNKDGTVPQDNPFVGDTDPDTLDTIWAYGLRNPFRAEWDLGSDPARFFIGDVGGNSAPDYEEVNVATLADAGTNYGWPRCENVSRSNKVDGTEVPCDVEQTAPVYANDHSVGNSITGGEVYRGQQFPTEYQGAYFFGDYAKDWIKFLTFDENGDVAAVKTFEDDADGVNAITVGPDGTLYWTSITEGAVYAVSYTGNKAPAIESVSASPTSATSAPHTVNFAVSASDVEEDELSYAWTFGDGSTGTGASTSHTYGTEGVYEAYVEVTDGTHTVESEQIDIVVGEPPVVTIDAPVDGSSFRAGDDIAFSASATDAQDGQLTGDSLSWDIDFDHTPDVGADHDHPVLRNYAGDSGTYAVPTSGHAYMTDTSYTLTVTATDSDGLSASDSVTIEPDKVDVAFGTSPNGLDYSVDGLPQTGSVTYDTLVDFGHEVSAPETQCLNGRQYAFQSWSDGGARTHVYTVPDADATLTATYADVGECSAPVSDGLVAQYEADAGLSTDGDAVTGWADQSGQGNDLTAAGDPSVTTAPSGLAAVSFDGAGDKLERTVTLNGLPSGNADRTVVLVTKYDSAGYGGFAFGNPSQNEVFGTVVNPNGDLMVQGWGGPNDFGSGVAGTGEGWLVQTATLDSGTLTHHKDGQLIDTRSHSYDTNLQQLVLGAEIDSSPYVDMEVGAAYVYDRALSDEERGRVEQYLAAKYLSEGGSANQPPTADFHYHDPVAGQSATYHAEATDADGSIVSYEWDFDGDGNFEESTTSETIDYAFASAGDYEVTLRVTDDDGATATATNTVTVAADDSGGSDDSLVTDGLVAHFEADSGLSTDGDTVTGWADQSESGLDLAGVDNPTLVQDGLNGRPVVSLDGGSDGTGDKFERTGDLTGLPSGAQDRSMFFLVKYENANYWAGTAFGNGARNQGFGLIVREGSGRLDVSGWGTDMVSDTQGAGAGWLVQSVTVADDAVTHYKNGTEIDSGTHEYNTNLGADGSKFVIGEELSGDGYNEMEVAAVLVYDRALSDEERQRVETYLDEKYFQIQPENEAPTAGDDAAAVAAGGSTTVDVLGNDADADGSLDASSVTVADAPTSGSATVNANGSITYAHDGSASTSDSFTYTVNDDDGAASETATVTVSVVQEPDDLSVLEAVAAHGDGDDATVSLEELLTATDWWKNDAAVPGTGGQTISLQQLLGIVDLWESGETVGDDPDPVNQLPTAGDDAASVDAGGSVTIDVLGNDADPEDDLDVSSVTVDSGPAHGTATVNANGSVTYVHDGSASTSDSFVYTVMDAEGAGDAATVTLSIEQLTDDSLPVQNGLVTHLAADQGITTGSGDVIAGWADQSGQGNDLTAVGDPMVKHDTLDGRPVVSFDGDGDRLERTDNVSGLPSGNADRTVLYVVNYQSSPSFGGGVAYGAATCTQTFGLITHEGNLMVQSWCDDYGSGTAADVGPDGWMTQSATLANGQLTHYKNGTQIDQFDATFATTPESLVVGAEIDGTPTVDMEVAEVLVYDRALTDEERGQVEQYLAAKYFQGSGAEPSPNADPTAALTHDPAAPTAGQTVTFDASASTDADGSVDEYAWDFDDDGSVDATGVQTSHTFDAAGDYAVTLTVTDDDGATDSVTEQVSVSAPTPQTIDLTAPTEGETLTGDSVTVSWTTENMGETDHVHVYLDGADKQGSQPQNGSYTYEGVAPGQHTATVVVATFDHVEYEHAAATRTVNVTVEAASQSSLVTDGLVAQFEADSGLSTDGDAVTGWADQSGSGLSLAASGDPTLVQDGLNGRPAVSFDGDGDSLASADDLSALPSGSQDRTMFVVAAYDGANAWSGAAFGNGDSNEAFGLVVNANKGKLTVQGWGGNNDLVSETQGAGEGWLVQSATVANDEVTHYKNGQQIDSGTRTYATTLDAEGSQFVVGEEIAGLGYADMDVAAVLVYDRALSDEEREQVERYLDEKYGVGASSDSDA